MASLLLLRRGISRGVLTLVRERQWFTALGALFGVFVMVQLLVLVLTGLEGMQSMLRNRTELQLEIHAAASQTQVQHFYTALTRLPYVQEATFITKEKAYEKTRKSDPALIGFLEEYNMHNPFSDTIGVSLSSLKDYAAFAAFVEGPEWKTVVSPTYLSEITNQQQHVYSLLTITKAGRSLTILILVLTITALVCITTELVRRRAIARSDEVLVESLSGAQPFSIALPFMTEAATLLLLSILLSTVSLILIIAIVPILIPQLQADGILGPLQAEITPLLSTMLPAMILLEIMMAPIIATCGAWLGIRPQVISPRISFAV
jgi:cell division protein FtsX